MTRPRSLRSNIKQLIGNDIVGAETKYKMAQLFARKRELVAALGDLFNEENMETVRAEAEQLWVATCRVRGRC